MYCHVNECGNRADWRIMVAQVILPICDLHMELGLDQGIIGSEDSVIAMPRREDRSA